MRWRVFTARYGLGIYIKHIRFFLKCLTKPCVIRCIGKEQSDWFIKHFVSHLQFSQALKLRWPYICKVYVASLPFYEQLHSNGARKTDQKVGSGVIEGMERRLFNQATDFYFRATEIKQHYPLDPSYSSSESKYDRICTSFHQPNFLYRKANMCYQVHHSPLGMYVHVYVYYIQTCM